ncbi:GAF and ANTAR domain-containing protein [Kineococcus sp. SYSU DK006]|uniref:GAF and ANTAR domain-containing protein n=1 Tax=Kineococcus sp. SYSU DK006 TaxID=3383127 RepID=UPI003D7D8142
MSAADHGQVIRTLVTLADSLVADYEPYELLQRLVDECTRLLDVDAAGLLLARGDGGLRVAAASSERVLELLQVRGDEGPCLEAYSRGERVVAGEPAELEVRWVGFAADMSAAGLRSAAAVPLRLREHRLGALGLFSEREHLPTAEDVDIAQAFADIATIAVLQQRAVHDSRTVSAQLQQALDSRVVIEQAKGVVAAQLDLDMAQAFTLLRDHARTRQLSLRHVAAAVTTGDLSAQDLRPRGAPAASRQRR